MKTDPWQKSIESSLEQKTAPSSVVKLRLNRAYFGLSGRVNVGRVKPKRTMCSLTDPMYLAYTTGTGSDRR